VLVVQLRCPWEDWAKVQKDEQREQRLIEYLEEGEPLEDVVLDAAEEVFDAFREEVFVEHRRRGYTRWTEVSAARAGVEGEPWRKRPALRNRSGTWFIPDKFLADLAMAFAAVEPETVHFHLDLEEQTLLREGYWLDEHPPSPPLQLSKAGPAVLKRIDIFARNSSEASTCCERRCTTCVSAGQHRKPKISKGHLARRSEATS
jgi:hypothetical protein